MTTAPAPSPGKNFPRSLFEWFWRGGALRRTRAAQQARSDLTEYAERARIAAEVGDRTLDPPSPWTARGAERLAAGLFVESIAWSVQFYASAASETAASASPLRSLSPAELTEQWANEQPRLLEAAGDPDALERVKAQVLERSFELAATSATATSHAARELGQVAKRLLVQELPGEEEAARLVTQRALRLGGLLVLLLVAAFGLTSMRDGMERRADLSIGRPWTTSSSYEVVATSPSREHPKERGFFFHTQEERGPWLELDLQQARRFSTVRVFNRQDCCSERAVPLAIEVSQDHEHWTEVARRGEAFSDWRAHFKPVSARWLRLRSPRKTILHLEGVRVLE